MATSNMERSQANPKVHPVYVFYHQFILCDFKAPFLFVCKLVLPPVDKPQCQSTTVTPVCFPHFYFTHLYQHDEVCHWGLIQQHWLLVRSGYGLNGCVSNWSIFTSKKFKLSLKTLTLFDTVLWMFVFRSNFDMLSLIGLWINKGGSMTRVWQMNNVIMVIINPRTRCAIQFYLFHRLINTCNYIV